MLETFLSGFSLNNKPLLRVKGQSLCHCYCCCCQVASVLSDSVWPRRWQPTRLHRPWDSPDKNTGVGCHFLLQCMKVKSESEVAQLCPTLCNPMHCSLPGSCTYGILQSRVLEWVATALVCYKIWHSINLSGSKTKYTSGMKVAVISQSVMSDVIKRIHFCKQNFCVFKEYSMRIWCPHI